MSHKCKSKCNGRSNCKCVKCCEPEPQCKVIVCPQFTCIVGDPDMETDLPLGTIFASAGTGRLFVVTPSGVQELVTTPVV